MRRNLLLCFIKQILRWWRFRCSVRWSTLRLIRTSLLVPIILIPEIIIRPLFNQLISYSIWILELIIILRSACKTSLSIHCICIFSWILWTISLSTLSNNIRFSIDLYLFKIESWVISLLHQLILLIGNFIVIHVILKFDRGSRIKYGCGRRISIVSIQNFCIWTKWFIYLLLSILVGLNLWSFCFIILYLILLF